MTVGILLTTELYDKTIQINDTTCQVSLKGDHKKRIFELALKRMNKYQIKGKDNM